MRIELQSMSSEQLLVVAVLGNKSDRRAVAMELKRRRSRQ